MAEFTAHPSSYPMENITQSKMNKDIKKALKRTNLPEDYQRDCREWWDDKVHLFPGTLDQAPVLSSFPDFSTFKTWYSTFFLNEIKDKHKTAELVDQIRSLETQMRIVQPDDPTIFPLSEQPLQVQTRSTDYGGALSKIVANLPPHSQVGTSKIVVVAKYVPEILSAELEAEKEIHGTFRKLGVEYVTEPLTLNGQVITYKNYSSSLEDCLRDMTQEERVQHVLHAIALHTHLTLDMLDHQTDPEWQPLWKHVNQRSTTANSLTRNFIFKYLMRTAAANDGVEPQAPEVEVFKNILLGSQQTPTQEQRKQYPDLTALVESPATRHKIQAFREFANDLAQHPNFPSHDDFTAANILVQEKHGIPTNLTLHDVGLINAPIQSHLFDMIFSAGLDYDSQFTVVKESYDQITQQWQQCGRTFPYDRGNFEVGLELMTIDKSLKQAALAKLKGTETPKPLPIGKIKKAIKRGVNLSKLNIGIATAAALVESVNGSPMKSFMYLCGAFSSLYHISQGNLRLRISNKDLSEILNQPNFIARNLHKFAASALMGYATLAITAYIGYNTWNHSPPRAEVEERKLMPIHVTPAGNSFIEYKPGHIIAPGEWDKLFAERYDMSEYQPQQIPFNCQGLEVNSELGGQAISLSYIPPNQIKIDNQVHPVDNSGVEIGSETYGFELEKDTCTLKASKFIPTALYTKLLQDLK
jgi:hypothetical protein